LNQRTQKKVSKDQRSITRFKEIIKISFNKYNNYCVLHYYYWTWSTARRRALLFCLVPKNHKNNIFVVVVNNISIIWLQFILPTFTIVSITCSWRNNVKYVRLTRDLQQRWYHLDIRLNLKLLDVVSCLPNCTPSPWRCNRSTNRAKFFPDTQ